MIMILIMVMIMIMMIILDLFISGSAKQTAINESFKT